MHIASLEARTTLNTCNLWKLALRGHLVAVEVKLERNN